MRFFCSCKDAKIYVEGYRRQDGTEVKGYWRDK